MTTDRTEHFQDIAMALHFNSLKQINKKDTFTVFGYCRQIQNKYCLPHFPALISYICLSHYHQMDYFEIASAQSALEISSDKSTITESGTQPSYWDMTMQGSIMLGDCIAQLAQANPELLAAIYRNPMDLQQVLQNSNVYVHIF